MAEENASSADSALSSSPNLTQGGEINPNQRLCSVLLNEFNYLLWSRAVSLALGGRSKLGFINGSSEPPESTLHKPMMHGTPLISWSCPGCLTLWSQNCLSSSATQRLPFSYESLLKRCMAAKTTQFASFN